MVRAKIAVFGTIAMSAMRIASGADMAWQQDTVGKMGIATVLEVMRITSDHCSEVAPQLQPEFDTLIASLTPRFWSIGNALLLSDDFKDLGNQAVPAAMIDVMRKEFQSLVRIREKGASAGSCPEELKDLRKLENVSIKKELSASFSMMRVILKDIEMGRVR
jgi:hypothetical protein